MVEDWGLGGGSGGEVVRDWGRKEMEVGSIIDKLSTLMIVRIFPLIKRYPDRKLHRHSLKEKEEMRLRLAWE